MRIFVASCVVMAMLACLMMGCGQKQAKTWDENQMLVSLGSKFSNLSADDMRTVVKQTKFYYTADKGSELFNDQQFQTEIIPRVSAWAVKREVVGQEPSVGFEDADADVNYTSKFIQNVKDGPTNTGDTFPAFTLVASEYPSWSIFFVADMIGIINGDEGGEMGPVETKWSVDIVLKEAEYDPCITLYASKTVDAVCITNIDILAPALGRQSVAICPTSTSNGADACVVVGKLNEIDDLKNVITYGLEKSVAHYNWDRNLEVAGKNLDEFTFKQMDPGAAAQAVQTLQENVDSIAVWNPYLLQTLRTRDDSKVLFSSTNIPKEIIDMIVIGKDSLEREGGENFACAIIDTFYQTCGKMEAPLAAAWE